MWVASWCLCIHVHVQDLGVNSFEQLCINFASEQLQNFVNKAVISQEQVSGSTVGELITESSVSHLLLETQGTTSKPAVLETRALVIYSNHEVFKVRRSEDIKGLLCEEMI